MTRITTLVALCAYTILPWYAHAGSKYKPSKMPMGTKITGSYATKDLPFKALIDGDKKTFVMGKEGTAKPPISLYLQFPRPFKNLLGIYTGESDPKHNYYPEEIEFWGDLTGEGKYQTWLGSTTNLGPGEQCEGPQLFNRLSKHIYGVEIRVTKHSKNGVNRAFAMNEINIIPSYSRAKTVNNKPVYYVIGAPKGTNIEANYRTASDGKPEYLIDNKTSTAIRGEANSAKKGNEVTISFKSPLKKLMGLQTGAGDKFGNYTAETITILVDKKGKKAFEEVGKLTNLGNGVKSIRELLFATPIPKAYAIKLRIDKQAMKGQKRAFVMNEVRFVVSP